MATAIELHHSEHYMSVSASFTGPRGREFGRDVLAALDRGLQHVVIDCREWRQLDFVLLSAMVKCADVFSSRGAQLELINLSAEMRANIRELRLQNRLRLLD